MPGLITSELQKALTRGAKSDKPVNVESLARNWKVPLEMVQTSLRELVSTGAVEIHNAPDDITIVTDLDVRRVVIYAEPVAQPRLSESPAVRKSRLETGVEDITGRDGQTIRATVLPEKQGDASTGFYLLSVCERPGEEGAEFLVADQRFDSQEEAWSHWDRLKEDLSPFAAKPEAPAFERGFSYQIGARTFALDFGPVQGGEYPWVCEIFEDRGEGQLSDLVLSLGGQTESEVWGKIEEWWKSAQKSAPLFDWLRTLSSDYDFVSESDETSEHDGSRVIEVDPDTHALAAESFGCRSFPHGGALCLVHDGDLLVASEFGSRFPGLDSVAETEPEPFERRDEYTFGDRMFRVEAGYCYESPERQWHAEIQEYDKDFDTVGDPIFLDAPDEDGLWAKVEEWWRRLIAQQAMPPAFEHILGNGQKITIMEASGEDEVDLAWGGQDWERIDLQIEHLDDVEANIALEDLLEKHGDGLKIFSNPGVGYLATVAAPPPQPGEAESATESGCTSEEPKSPKPKPKKRGGK